MNNIIDEHGSYKSQFFNGDNGTWKLIGSSSQGETGYQDRNSNWKYTSVGKTIDHFRNIDTGAYMDVLRVKVYTMAEQGKITCELPF